MVLCPSALCTDDGPVDHAVHLELQLGCLLQLVALVFLMEWGASCHGPRTQGGVHQVLYVYMSSAACAVSQGHAGGCAAAPSEGSALAFNSCLIWCQPLTFRHAASSAPLKGMHLILDSCPFQAKLQPK